MTAIPPLPDISDFLFEIDEMREDARFKFADATLLGIRETVEKTKLVTANQKRAIANIRESKEELQKEWTRRYEGANNDWRNR
jgi:multidrug resistance efflux pump